MRSLLVLLFSTFLFCMPKAIKEEDRKCEIVWESIFKNMQETLDSTESLVNLISGISGNSGTSPSLEEKQYSEQIIFEFTEDIDKSFQTISTLSAIAISQNCEYVNELTIKFKISKTDVNLKLGSIQDGLRWGDVEAYVIYVLSNAFLSIFHGIFSHNLDFDLAKFFRNVKYIDRSNLLGIIRSLGSIMQDNKEFLDWSGDEKRKERFFKIPENLANALNGMISIVPALEKRANKKGHVIEFYDNSGDGIIGFDPQKKTSNQTDVVVINVFGNVVVGDTSFNIYTIALTPSAAVTKEVVEDILSLMRKAKDSLTCEKRDTSFLCNKEFLHISDLNGILRALGQPQLEDIAMFSPQKFFSNPLPLRKILPYWFFDEDQGIYVFMIEGEVSEKYRQFAIEKSNYLFVGDSHHFLLPTTFVFENKYYDNSKNAIPKDCVEPINEGNLSFVIIPYLGFQSPSFSESLLIKLPQSCPSAYEKEKNFSDWKPADLYSLNKVIAIITVKYGGAIFPGLDIFYKSGITEIGIR